jgi:sulfate adenylyltransferase subunit 2
MTHTSDVLRRQELDARASSAEPRGHHGVEGSPARVPEHDHLDWLETEAIHIMREVAAECSNPVLLFSGGKDSLVMLRLAEKAFRPGRFPFPLLNIDTGHNFPELIEFRDRRAAELGERLIVRSVEDSIKTGRVRLKRPDEDRNRHQSVTLLDAIAEFGFDACFGGARRDEEKARAKERIFSFRDEFGQWDPKNQRPELWSLYNTRVNPGENMRVFPISNWTELDIWQYIARERLALPSLYFAHDREVIVRNGLYLPTSWLVQPKEGESVTTKRVRFRTLGDVTCTCPVESHADTYEKIVDETIAAKHTERGATRLDDQTSEASMELRKKEGYF